MCDSKVIVIGGTGLVGTTMARTLRDAGHVVTTLSRAPARTSPDLHGIASLQADAAKPGHWQERIPDFDVVVNLSGAPIFRRWTARGRQQILCSRLATTRNVVNALRKRKGCVRQFYNASGVGYYGSSGDAILDETGMSGSGFIAHVAARWEDEVEPVSELGIQPVICRLGHVLGCEGGALPKLLKLARLHLASRWGTGEQWVSWIHVQDVARAVLFLIENHQISGPVNVTSPHPVRNRDLMNALARVTATSVLAPPVPEWGLRLLLGQFSSVFVNGQRVIPARLIDSGFRFEYADLDVALQNLTTREY